MPIKRILKHLNIGPRDVRRAFPRTALQKITEAIRIGELQHTGQVRFMVEDALGLLTLFKNTSARERALEVFSRLRIWDTEHNNGVLIYLLLADKDVEIIVDRGASSRIPEKTWQDICQKIEVSFSQGFFIEGVLEGIETTNQVLTAYFPRTSSQVINDLPDQPVVL